jgi:hypothetical protein
MAHLLDVARQRGTPFIVESLVDQVANAAPLYLDGSQIQVPQSDLGERTHICWTFVMTKTAVGVAAPSINVRVGKTGTIADAIRLAFALPAQTAAVDTALVEVSVLIRNGGIAAVFVGVCDVDHNGGATGFSTNPTPVLSVVSAPFNLTGDDNTIALSVNPGDAVWTVQMVRTELELT